MSAFELLWRASPIVERIGVVMFIVGGLCVAVGWVLMHWRELVR